MDTRTKIVDRPNGRSQGKRLHVVRGWFDVLTADQCRLLQEAKPADGSLLVLVYRDTASHPSPLTARDRAQMVAALGCVDEVLVCDESEATTLSSSLGPDTELDAGESTGRDVVRDVLERQGAH